MSERAFSRLILAAVLLVTAIGLWPDLALSRVDQSDDVYHFAILDGMVHAVEHGANPIDFWSPDITFGSPVFRTYQPLAHALVAAAYFALGKSVSLVTLFALARFLAMWLLPLSFYAAASLLELAPLACAAAALLAPMISTVGGGLFGLEYRSYLWIGFGLYPQSVAVHILLLAMGFGWQAVRTGRRRTLTGALLGATALLHFIYGYIGAVTLVLLALLPDKGSRLLARLARTVWIGAAAFLLALFQLIPLVRDSAILNRSRLEPAVKYDSYGPGQILKWLFTGDLFDYLRLPVLTLLFAAGIALAVWRIRRSRQDGVAVFLLGGALFWLLVYFGRSLWGPLLYLIGVTPDLQLHRVIGGFQIFAVLVAALALEALWRALGKRSAGLAAAATLVLLFPMVRERAVLFGDNAAQGAQNLALWDANRSGVDAMLAAARRNSGRAYAGLGAGHWGGNFKIGATPFYAALYVHHIPAVSFIYSNLALPSDIMMRFDDRNPEHYRLFNVRTAITPDLPGTPAFLAPRERSGAFQAFDAPGNGYFAVVDVPAAVPTGRHTFYDINDRWLHSEWMPQHRHLLLDFFGDAPPGLPRLDPAAALPPAPGTPPAGTVTAERESYQQYEADLTAARPAWALFKMTWHQNWHVTVDGHAVKTAMLSPGFLGVPVTAGTHRVMCRYQGDNWRLWLALAGALAVAGMSFAERSVGLLAYKGERQLA
jgi:hypothetical protein